ncbi:MAG: prolipoprotein diacylglyceryl transferase [Flavobacteriaceae bacterium]|nr:prolipoprotein diacylglyceryl transferase [Flavobacteriaceae bacterium]|tara:strand:+ start:6201 stop:7031 length:831 start_codon:yes stop_codon:yes gene_type:complete
MNDFIIEWAPNEIIFSLGPIAIRWYSLMFLLAFYIGFQILKKIYIKEKKNVALLDPFLIHMVLGTIIGARLGEVFFYNWEYFQNNLLEIFLPIKLNDSGIDFVGFRGLSSHGATVGIIISIIIYKIRYKYDSVLWIFDRLVIAVALGGMFVRVGNFFNSEIVGKFTNSDFGVVFLNRGDSLPRHPAQLYEAFGYLILFVTLVIIYNKSKLSFNKGFIFGYFLTTLFIIRFVVEYVKESQGGIENTLGIISTGQWLSIPFIIMGILLMINSFIIKKY